MFSERHLNMPIGYSLAGEVVTFGNYINSKEEIELKPWENTDKKELTIELLRRQPWKKITESCTNCGNTHEYTADQMIERLQKNDPFAIWYPMTIKIGLKSFREEAISYRKS
jgi:hypothetical protein